MYDLRGQVAVITGAGRKKGIGFAIARRLARAGAHIVVTDLCRHPDPAVEAAALKDLEAIAAELSAIGPQAAAIRADITNREEVETLFAQAYERFGRLDILVNNAGVLVASPLMETTPATFQLCMNVHAWGTFLCSQAAIPYLERGARGGSIINMSSISGKTGGQFFGAYSASKFAAMGITQSMALELAPKGIRVNAVCPGLVETDMYTTTLSWIPDRLGLTPEEYRDRDLQRIPLGRTCSPDEVADVVAYLASADAAYMTGQGVNVNGGMVMY